MEPLEEGWLDAAAACVAGLEASGIDDGVAVFTVSGAPAGTAAFHVAAAGGRLSLAAGTHPSPDVTLAWSYVDFVELCGGRLTLESAYMSGRVKVEGDRILLFDGWRPLLRIAG